MAANQVADLVGHTPLSCRLNCLYYNDFFTVYGGRSIAKQGQIDGRTQNVMHRGAAEWLASIALRASFA